MPCESRSAYWDDVVDLVERSRRDCEAFDPDAERPAAALDEGIAPILSLYIEARREGVRLSTVERSLLEGVLNDWMEAYARSRGEPCSGGYTLHEVAIEYSRRESLVETVDGVLSY